MSRVLAAVAAASLWFAPAPVDAGACARTGLDAALITHPGDAIPVGGGVLIGWARGGAGFGLDFHEGDPAVQKTWRFLVRKRKLRPTMTVIAPGLVVYTPKKVSKGAKLSLVDGHGAKLGTFATGKKKRAFTAAAPSGKLEISSYTSPRSGTSWGAMVTLDAAIPADAVALVVYDSRGALTWGNVKDATGTMVNVFASPGRCSGNPPDLQLPGANQKVQLAWVDQFGRLSPRSADITVVDTTGATP